MQGKLNASCAHQIYYSCSEKMRSRSDSRGSAVSFVCSHFTVNRILCFAGTTWPWTDIEDYMLMTGVQAQFTGKMERLPLFSQKTQSWGRASGVQAARACHSRQWACSTAKTYRVPPGSCMPACIKENTLSPKGASAKVVAVEEATESCWTEEQSWRERLVLRKYAGLEEGFVFKHLILICFTQQTEMLSFLKDFLFPSRDWKPLWWLWYVNLTGKVGQFSLEFWPRILVKETRCICINTHMYQCMHISAWAIQS